MKKYAVTIVKQEIYEVEAENEDDAIELACDLCDEDVDAFQNLADEFEVEEMLCTE